MQNIIEWIVGHIDATLVVVRLVMVLAAIELVKTAIEIWRDK